MEDLLSLLVGIIFAGLVCIIVFRAIRTKRFPENNYTPFDDIMEGKIEGDDDKS